jgi:hypothetical protein
MRTDAMSAPSPTSTRVRHLSPWLVVAILSLASCRQANQPATEGTAFPGQVSTGGATSGEVIAQAGRQKPSTPGPEGTPGIPQGAGGNTGGPAMGGTSGSANAAKPAAESEAEKQKQLLAAAMDQVAARWRQQAQSARSDPSGSPPVDAGQGFEQSRTQSSASGQPAGRLSPLQQPPPSEKHGTATPSEDVKQPQGRTPEGAGASVPAEAYKPAP